MNIVPYSEKEIPDRKYYLVDFHSVRAEGLDGMEELSGEDKLIIFFSKSDDNVSFSFLSKLYSCKAEIIMKEIENNDLINPVILVFIGSIINEDADIHLVCKDSGNFIKATEIAIGNGINISVQQSISGVEIPPLAPESLISEELLNTIKFLNTSEETKQNLYNLIKSAIENYLNNNGDICDYVSNGMYGWAYRYDMYTAIEPHLKAVKI